MRKRSVFRKPSLKASFKARTTGRAKRAVKRAIIPGYGKKEKAQDSLKIQNVACIMRFIIEQVLIL